MRPLLSSTMFRRIVVAYWYGFCVSVPVLIIGEDEAHRQQFRPVDDFRKLIGSIDDLDRLSGHQLSSNPEVGPMFRTISHETKQLFGEGKEITYRLRDREFTAADETAAGWNGFTSLEPWLAALIWPHSVPRLVVAGVGARLATERVSWLETHAAKTVDQMLEMVSDEVDEWPEQVTPFIEPIRQISRENVARLVRLAVWLPEPLMREAVVEIEARVAERVAVINMRKEADEVLAKAQEAINSSDDRE